MTYNYNGQKRQHSISNSMFWKFEIIYYCSKEKQNDFDRENYEACCLYYYKSFGIMHHLERENLNYNQFKNTQ